MYKNRILVYKVKVGHVLNELALPFLTSALYEGEIHSTVALRPMPIVYAAWGGGGGSRGGLDAVKWGIYTSVKFCFQSHRTNWNNCNVSALFMEVPGLNRGRHHTFHDLVLILMPP
jgi:hypothetical protein